MILSLSISLLSLNLNLKHFVETKLIKVVRNITKNDKHNFPFWRRITYFKGREAKHI